MCSILNVEADESLPNQGFFHRLLAGVQRGAADCGVELLNSVPNPTAWPLPVTRQEMDGVVLPLGDELAPHPAFPAPIPAVFIFSGPRRPFSGCANAGCGCPRI